MANFIIDARSANPPDAPDRQLSDAIACVEQLPDQIALVAQCRPLRLLFANAFALRAFATSDLAALNLKVMETSSPDRDRLSILAETLAPGSPARLQRLRVFVAGHARSLVFSCSKIAVRNGEALILIGQDVHGATPVVGVIVGAAAGAASASATRPPLAAVESRVRFTWCTDAQHRIVSVGPELMHGVGADHALHCGEVLPERLKALKADAGGVVETALATRASWSRIALHWPRSASAEPLEVLLSGSPVFDTERRFVGYRGFGGFHRSIGQGSDAPFEPTEVNVSAPSSESASHPIDNETAAPSLEAAAMASASLAVSAGAQTVEGALALSAVESSAFEELGAGLRADLERGNENAPPAEQASASWASGINDIAVLHATPGSDHAVAIDRLPVGVLVTRESASLYANRTLLELLGYPDLETFRASGGVEAIWSKVASTLHQGNDLALTRADGGILSVDAHLQAITWNGAAATLTTIRRSFEAELTARTADTVVAAGALERDNAELRAVLDIATDGVAVLDSQGRIVSLNRSGEALFGLDTVAVFGEPFTVLLAPECREEALDYFAGLRGSGVARVMNDGREVVGRTRHGGTIPMFMSLGQLMDTPDARYCAILRDLTPWKRMESDLDQARRTAERTNMLSGDFLARVSQEIRSPLEIVLSLADSAAAERLGPLENERYKHCAGEIHAAATRMMTLVSGFFDLTQVEAGTIQLRFAPLNANRIVAACMAQMQPEADVQRVILRQALAPRLPNVVADEASFRKIILNLLSNAIRFNSAGGQVIVSTALTDSGTAVVRIRDTGCGMTDAEVSAALEPFRYPSSRGQSGIRPAKTGFGLPLSRALTEANRAALSIKSRKNEGTLVEVAFPAERVLLD